ncbi:MAG: alpha/beta hydrolase [Bacteroidetes bacterium]|nr:alpha/beta hydrolase [Bacteroidota bacterium]
MKIILRKFTIRKTFNLIFLLSVFSFAFSYSSAQTKEDNNGAYVGVNGAKLWYEIKGSGEPIVLIPGGPGNSHIYFTPWFDELAKNYKVIYYDAFGRGKSDRAKDSVEYTFNRDVNDLEGLRKALGFKKWNVLGHSYGGMVAQAYALKYPSSVEKLILSNTFYSGEMWQENDNNSNKEIKNQFPEVWSKLMKLRNEGYNSSSPEHQKAYSVPSGLLYFYDASNAYKMRPDIGFNSQVYYTLVGYDGDFIIGGDIAKLDFRTKLKTLKMPILIIEGRFDRVAVPSWSIKYKEYAPQAKFVMFEKSGHNPYVEEKEKYFKLLNEFLMNEK